MRMALRNRVEKSSAYEAIERSKIGNSVGMLHERIAAVSRVVTRRHDTEMLRGDTLNAGEKLGIHGKLKNRSAPGVPRELRVDCFVRPRSKRARALDAAEHICKRGPAVGGQVPLHDRVDAGAHGVNRSRRRVIHRQGDDTETLGVQRLDESRLMIGATSLKQREDWIGPLGSRQHPVRQSEIEACAMWAAEKSGQVGRRKDQRTAGNAHI